MTSADPLPSTVLSRKAVVYVRQSTQTQVQVHLESQCRQYDLVDEARRHGFHNVDVIDDDLGRSASGTVARPGFEKLVAGLCAGEVGAVLCFDASRLARNGRDWHHLLELCGLVDARVIDLDGVYNPCRPNDRLLLGMKGSISEFELGVLRSRMLDAARSKARRGELRISVPIGFVWHREIGLGLDPDCRVQEVTRGIFQRFREPGSARQVHLALKVIDMVPDLKARLEAAIARTVALDPRPTTIIVSEETGLPYKADNFRHVFAQVRARAAKAHPKFEVDHLAPGRDMTDPDAFTVRMVDLTFMALRHTAITRLAEARCTTEQIHSISGHALGSIEAILKRYMVRTRATAITAFQARLDAEAPPAAAQGDAAIG